MKSPFFSIVIPVFNREREISRALQSCLSQCYENFEVVVVDDGSTDNSAAIVEGYDDSRVRLVRHSHNRGLGPAKNTGADIAKGEWIVGLDSDDELLPGALRIIEERISTTPDQVSRFSFALVRDNGKISPEPMFTPRKLDYENYVECFLGFTGAQDYVDCTLRSTFKDVRFTDNRAWEMLYHLEFARRYLTYVYPDIVYLAHTDAKNHIGRTPLQSQIPWAADWSDNALAILDSHGRAIQMNAPRQAYVNILWRAALYTCLSGRRLAGLSLTVRYLREAPTSRKGWALAVSAWTTPRLIVSMLQCGTLIRTLFSRQ